MAGSGIFDMPERRHFFFDLDGTLAEKCGVIPPELVVALYELEKQADVIIVTGATIDKARSQFNGYEPKYVLTQNGNVWHEDGRMTREELLPLIAGVPDIWKHIVDLLIFFNGGHVQHRGAQISYSPIGHDAPAELKRAFDPNMSKRKQALAAMPFLSEEYTVSIGGTTCFDYIRKDGTKGANVARFAGMHVWELALCRYFGDALEEGGNDHSVIGVCQTTAVKCPADTLSKIKL